MAYLDNPAGRLLDILESVRRVSPATQSIDAWSEVLGASPHDLGDFYSQVSRLFRLARSTRTLIEEMPDEEPSVLLEHYTQVENMLANFPRVAQLQIGQFLEPLDLRSGQHSLKLCSSLLHRKRPESTLSTTSVSNLREQLDELIEQVSQSDDLDTKTKAWILQSLREIAAILANLHIYGVPDLDSAAEKLTGGIVGKKDRIVALSRAKIGPKLVGFIVALDLVLNMAANFAQLEPSHSTPSSPGIQIIQEQLNIQIEPPALTSGLTSDVETNPRPH